MPVVARVSDETDPMPSRCLALLPSFDMDCWSVAGVTFRGTVSLVMAAPDF